MTVLTIEYDKHAKPLENVYMTSVYDDLNKDHISRDSFLNVIMYVNHIKHITHSRMDILAI